MQHIIISFAFLTILSCSAKKQDYQYSSNFRHEIGKKAIDPFFPISFSQEGINHFLQNIYNRSDYGTEFLPNNFTHMLQFLQHGITTQQGASYAQSVFKLFSNKLKSAAYVNAYVFADALTPLAKLLKHYFSTPPQRSVKKIKTAVNDVLYSTFLSQFDFFKKDPKKFFSSLSSEILTSLNHELAGSRKEIVKEQLRQTIVRFFELCVSKLVWCPDESENIWPSVKITSEKLAHMVKEKIIADIDHLDDLFWSITHRFCFFVDLTSSDLPLPFFQNIKQELVNKKPLLCKLEEQEKMVTSKADCLMQAMLSGEAKARAQEYGIVTN